MNKIISNPAVLVIITCLFIFFFLSLKKNEDKIKISTRSMDSIQKEVERLENEVKEAEEKLFQAQNPLIKEKIIRDELLMQKPGEYILQIPRLERKIVTLETENKTPLEEWMELIF